MGLGRATLAPGSSQETLTTATTADSPRRSEVTFALDPTHVPARLKLAFSPSSLIKGQGRGLGWDMGFSWAQRWAGPRPSHLAHVGSRGVEGENQVPSPSSTLQ